MTIDHREEQAGLSGNTRHYYVDCEVLFSEEEKGIIAARDLEKHTFTVGPALPLPATAHYVSARLLRGLAPVVLVASCGIGLGVNGALGDSLGMLALCMFVASFFVDRKTRAAEQPAQTISLERLLANPGFTIYAVDPVSAKRIDDGLRATLLDIKSFLAGSAEIRGRARFEL